MLPSKEQAARMQSFSAIASHKNRGIYILACLSGKEGQVFAEVRFLL